MVFDVVFAETRIPPPFANDKVSVADVAYMGKPATFIVENKSSDAWGYANNLIKNISQEDINILKKDVGTYESQNQKRQQSLHNYSKNNFFISSK